MRLRIILNKSEVMALTYIFYLFRIGATAVEVNNHEGSGALGDGWLDEGIVDLEGIDIGLYEDGLQATVGDGEDGGDVGVGGHDDLVTLLHDTHLDVGTEDEFQRIKAVAAADAVAGSDIVGIVLLKLPCSLATQVPAAL